MGHYGSCNSSEICPSWDMLVENAISVPLWRSTELNFTIVLETSHEMRKEIVERNKKIRNVTGGNPKGKKKRKK